MSESNARRSQELLQIARRLLFSMVVGALLALGVRSMFLTTDGSGATAHAGTGSPADAARGSHDDHGHRGHDHGGAGPSSPDEHGHQGHERGGERGSGNKDGARGSGQSTSTTERAAGVLLDLGNDRCPVMGGRVDGKTFSEWDGLRVGHCCPGCGKRFRANPEVLLDGVFPRWRDAHRSAQAVNAATGEAQERLIARAARSWRMLRRPTAKAADPAPGVLLDVGNAKCPVMRGNVDGKTFSEWNGLRVGHCCPGCGKRFGADPERLLDAVAPRWREAARAAKAIDAAEGDERTRLLASTEAKWRVVRRPSDERRADSSAGLLLDLANSKCPVMEGTVDGKTFSEWNGLRVGHCCPGCGTQFLRDPESLLDDVAPSWREAAAAVRRFGEADSAARARLLPELRSRWRVVREPAPPGVSK